MKHSIFDATFDSGGWELDADFPGGAWSRVRLNIDGCPMHLWAFRVKQSADGEQVAWQDEFSDEVEALQVLCGSMLQTTTLDGLDGEWVIGAAPHGD